MSKRLVTLDVNGEAREAAIGPGQTLLEVLRDTLDLTGAKRGCNQGVCGACTVLVDGTPVRGCLTLAVACTDARITTVEGLATEGTLSALQESFAAHGAVQCGFCTSGVLMTATAFLARNKAPTIEDVRAGLAGNLCRCTGYKKIVDAVHAAGQAINRGAA